MSNGADVDLTMDLGSAADSITAGVAVAPRANLPVALFSPPAGPDKAVALGLGN